MITLTESRYARQELITWWDQASLRDARVLVVGAGALGNEIVKNLALLGVGHMTIVDMDSIERSNLARCALFRDTDEGRLKAEVLALAAMQVNPDVEAVALTQSIMTVGLGEIAGFDLVIAGLDNREARLWIGQACRKLGMPWIDGAIEGLRGLVRVFLAEGPCYECTLGETDRRILSERKSCSLLSGAEMLGGKVPTNSTTASIIAGMQVQEAVKILVGRADLLALRNQAFMFTGDTLDTYVTSYDEDEYCLSHDRYEDLENWHPDPGTGLADLVGAAVSNGQAMQMVDLEQELVLSRRCSSCGWVDSTIRPTSHLGRGDGQCPDCDQVLTLEAGQSFTIDHPAMTMPVADLGLPHRDIVTIRSAETRRHFILELS